jgi:two-component system, LytTR family, response regulator
MSKLTVLIADDEPLARERLRALMRTETSFDIVGEAESGPAAVGAILWHRPDIVLLDVQMPGCDGLQVAAELPVEERPAIIFVTAHDKFAVDAFAVRAVDYLLKPFDQARLHAALQSAAEYLRHRQAGDLGDRLESLLQNAAPAARGPERLAFRVEGRVVFLTPEEIAWVEAADNYVVLHLVDSRRLMIRETLSVLEQRLGTTHFARISRSAVVRLDQVKELQPTLHRDYTVVLRDGTRLALSRSLRGRLEKLADGTL